jgi:hypothetical protein
MAPSPTPPSFLSFFSGAFFLGLFRLARFCSLFVYDPGSYLFFPSFVSPLFLKLLFDLFVLAFSLGTCATRHNKYLRFLDRGQLVKRTYLQLLRDALAKSSMG